MSDTETPAADPSAPAAPVAAPAETPSLVDGADPAAAPAADPAAPAADPAAPAAPAPAADPAEEAKWYLSEGVAGEGEAPDWFKADKYKSAIDQAKAYPELEKRFGAFTGAPKDGVYKLNPPEGLAVEFDTEHQLFQDLNAWAKDSQLSQKAYDDVVGMLARYEASVQPDMGEIKKQLGENADARISSVAQWAKSNLSDGDYEAFRDAQTQANAASVFKAFEAVIAKTRQVQLPKAGEDVPGLKPGGLEAVEAMRNKRNEKGERLYDIDPKHREEVEKANLAYWKSQEGKR